MSGRHSTLSDGDTGGNVKDLLELLTELDWVLDQAQIQQILGEIDFGDGSAAGRCDAVLPAFDTYFKAAGGLLHKLGVPNVLKGLKAAVPKSCNANAPRDVLEG